MRLCLSFNIDLESGFQFNRAAVVPYCDLLKPEFMQAVMAKYGFRDWDSVMAAIGHGGLKEGQVGNRLLEEYKKKQTAARMLTELIAESDAEAEYLATVQYEVETAEGEAALADILGEDKPMGTVPVPVCTYTIPCFASVGLTTEAAKAAGYDPVLGSFNYEANGMALAEGAKGSVFAVMDRTSRKTLGMTIVGENASEMIALATSAVADGLTAEQWERMIVAHPSLCEMVREAALDAFGMSVHKG